MLLIINLFWLDILECDSDHSQIEKMKKKTNINVYHPHDWMQIVRQTGKKNPSMDRCNFFEFSSLLKKEDLQIEKFNDDGEKFINLKIYMER